MTVIFDTFLVCDEHGKVYVNRGARAGEAWNAEAVATMRDDVELPQPGEAMVCPLCGGRFRPVTERARRKARSSEEQQARSWARRKIDDDGWPYVFQERSRGLPDYDPDHEYAAIEALARVVYADRETPIHALAAAQFHQKFHRQKGPPPHHRDAPLRICSKCQHGYRERWIYRRHGRLMCATCCEIDGANDWVQILPGAAYSKAA